MNLLAEIQKIFQLEKITVSERIKILEASFEVTTQFLPNFIEIERVVTLTPQRDSLKIYFLSDSGDSITILSKKVCSNQNYHDFCESLDSDSIIKVSILIEKNVEDSTFSVYDFSRFSEDLLQLNVKQIMSGFSLLLQNCEYLIFDLFDQNYFFTTGTMVFVSGEKNKFCKNLLRSKRLQSCKETSYFYNMSTYELLPDDFSIEIDFENNPLSNLFNRICTILSLAYISSSASLEDSFLKIQISGQRNVDFTYHLANFKCNVQSFKIYRWVYTDGSSIDKVIIARNIISLHCRYSDLIDIDEKTFSSIQSNYNLYLKNNVTQYLELKNKLAEFICDVVSKTGDYATLLLGRFKSNLIAIFGFLFTVILANIVSKQPLKNIFTKDITAIIEFILFGSVIYLVICTIETKYTLKKAEESYYALKDNYKSILSDIDLEEIFKGDTLITKTSKSVKRGIRGYAILWAGFLILSFFLVEWISSDPVIKPFIKELLMYFFSA